MTPAPALTPDLVTAAARCADGWIALRRRTGRVPGVQTAVLFADRVVSSGAHGLADVERGAPLTGQHLFRIASHSKTFTATALLQLAEQGRLRLDDPLSTHLPWTVQAGPQLARATLRELLSHGAGLVRDGHDGGFWQLRAPFPDAGGLRAIAADSAAVLPRGERFKYSNIAYGLLGLVVEAAGGRPYAEVVTTRILQPLGLRDTACEYDPDRAGDYATGYSALSYADTRIPIEHVDTRALAAATGFGSTATDVVRWAAAHFLGDERLLDDDSKRLAQREEWVVDPDEADGRGYGLGFAVERIGDRRLVGHGGGYPGHITKTLFDPVARLAVAVATNCIDGPAAEMAAGTVKLVDLFARHAAGTGDDPQLERFTGRFASLWGVLDVVRCGGALLALDPAQADPTAHVVELAVDVSSGVEALRVVRDGGYGSHGELWPVTFGADGSVVELRGPSAMTMRPVEEVTAEVARLDRVRARTS
ncbi:serine hydrolase domain-containing protein [Kineococcus glutinatus]|uniref:Serine hydrolase domain-containing protein n=1 Tax=Kineococcus glutinatus TaxID=1070872 RepID=A0ABP9HQW6_9ACTN